MRQAPDMQDELDRSDVAEMAPEPWMLELLKINPEYVHWGPDEDYMWKEGTGWDSRLIIESWADFKWQLDDLNECVHFYFEIDRPVGDCVCRVQLVLWILHPRKGCSRGVRVERVKRTDLPAVFAWLREAAKRNAERFGKIPAPTRKSGDQTDGVHP